MNYRGVIAAALVLWLAVSSLAAHPDYLPYFNLLAGDEPEKILAESDLDWGQDVKRLAARLREAGAQSLSYLPFAYLDPGPMGLPPLDPEPDILHPAPGWNAVSITLWKVRRMSLLDRYPQYSTWPDHATPLERVGKGMFLYYFPPR